jgi:hypothetical protein
LNCPPALTTGTLDTSAASQTTATGVASVASSNVASVSLLGGLVSASAVTSVSTASRDNSTGALSVSAAGTQFARLSVAGIPIGGTPAPNTKINLPGVGYVMLNQQTSSIGAISANMTVIGLHVVAHRSTAAERARTGPPCLLCMGSWNPIYGWHRYESLDGNRGSARTGGSARSGHQKGRFKWL